MSTPTLHITLYSALDVHFEAVDGLGVRGGGGGGGGEGGLLVDGAELGHHAVQEQQVVRAHPHPGPRQVHHLQIFFII